MDHGDETTITPDDVRAIARVAALEIDDARAAALAAGIDADLRAIRRLRTVDAGELHPLGATALPLEQR